MSEASEDKTKRKFITLLQSYPWESKLNLYFDSQEFGNNIYEYLGRINRSLTTKNPDIGFLYRVCINMTKKYVFSESKELGLALKKLEQSWIDNDFIIDKNEIKNILKLG